MESVSRKIVFNKSVDLLKKVDPKKIISLKKETEEIIMVKNEWNDKMRIWRR